MNGVGRSGIQDHVAVGEGGAVAVAGLTKRFFNHIQKNFLINIWGYPQKGNYYFIGNTISRNHYHRPVFKCRGQVLEPAGVGDGAPIPYKV